MVNITQLGLLASKVGQCGVIIAHCSLAFVCRQSDCGGEDAIEKHCSVSDDAVRFLSYIVCAVLASEQGVSWME